VDYAEATGDRSPLALVANTYDKRAPSRFRAHFYDDEAWWALAWLRAHNLTNEVNGMSRASASRARFAHGGMVRRPGAWQAQYLAMAEDLFGDIEQGWSDEPCGGGMWWDKKHSYKNAITNALFLTLAAGLYARTGRAEYLKWADKAWGWFNASGLINAQSLINDGLDGQCRNNNQTTWTYNQVRPPRSM
jgi:predicted alpha-1,6-mannanase (GH76 family)